MKNIEYYLEFKKYDIFLQSWLTESSGSKGESLDSKGKKHLLIVHGLGEHSSRYNHMAHALTQSGINCHSYDIIGHGQSTGQRGYVSQFDLFLDQLLFVYNFIKKENHLNQLDVFAHSMGGLISLHTLIQDGFDNSTKFVFSNPLVGINVEIPKWKQGLAKNVSHLMPRLALDNEINDFDLTKDQDVLDSYKNDPLRHRKISTKLYCEFLDQTERLRLDIKPIANKSLFLISPNDKVCDSSATQDFIKNFEFHELELFPQSGHEIINDLSKDRSFERIIKFLKGES